MKTKSRTGAKLLGILLLLAIVFGAGFYLGGTGLGDKAEVVSPGAGATLPSEVEKRIVTRQDVESQLVEIKEISTYSGEYKVTKSVDFTRYLLDNYAIPGTTNRVKLECTGIVKVGYDIDDIAVRVSESGDGGTIYISLPEPKINDNYLIWDKVQCEEVNSIFNPIDFDQYKTMIAEIEEEGLAQVEEAGIYKAAEDNIKMIIENFLKEFEGYTVEYR